MVRHKPLNELLEYWHLPNDNKNIPEMYLDKKERSKFLLMLIKKYGLKDFSYLELGCNCGRNLKYLYDAGYNKLSGVDIDTNAINLLISQFPLMSKSIKIYNNSIEDIIKSFKSNQFNIVFTMAVLQHIHYNSSWIFKEIKRITRNYLMIIENERMSSWTSFPRNYKEIFEGLGLTQIEVIKNIKGLKKCYYARIFKTRD